MYKPSHKHKRRNAESEWLLDPNTQNYYRYYVDANGAQSFSDRSTSQRRLNLAGNTQYVWYDGDEAESSHADIPRDPQAASMAEITEGMGNLSHDAYETQRMFCHFSCCIAAPLRVLWRPASCACSLYSNNEIYPQRQKTSTLSPADPSQNRSQASRKAREST